MGTKRVVIRHPETGGVHIVSATAVEAHAQSGWVVLDANAPKADVVAAAETLGVPVDPENTRATILSDLTGDDADDAQEG